MNAKFLLTSMLLGICLATIQGQSPYCSNSYSHVSTIDGESIELLSGGPYKGNYALLKFNKKTIAHTGCNDNSYEPVLRDDFDQGIDPNLWTTYFPVDAPLDRQHIEENKDLLYLDGNAQIENGELKLGLIRDNPHYWYQDQQGVWKLITAEWSGGMVYGVNTHDDPEWSRYSCGCYKYGKFSIRAKIPKEKRATSAFWFWGCNNEIDVFEFLRRPDHLQATIHQWNVPINGDNHATYDLIYDNFGDLSEAYHEYTLEWTPYKISWLLDGNVFRTFYRYYTKVTNDQEEVCFYGLDCSSIPEGEEVEVWEIVGWDKLASHPVDIILNIGINRRKLGGNPNTADFKIDWVDIQQIPNRQLSGSQIACPGEEITITSDGGNAIWETSSNIEVLSMNPTSITVVADQETNGWVRASGKDNYTLYGTNSELKSYNCYETEMSVKTNVSWAGAPTVPYFENDYDPCTNIFTISISNPEGPNTTYNWTAVAGGHIIGQGDNNAIIKLYHNPPPDFTFTVEVTNDCGSFTFDGKVPLRECDSGDFSKTTIYPNPANDRITVNLNLNKELSLNSKNQTVDILIINSVTGAVMRQFKTDESRFYLNVADWQAGTYVMTISDGETIDSKTFTIIRE